jgi:ATP-dependent DNA helicase RecQ
LWQLPRSGLVQGGLWEASHNHPWGHDFRPSYRQIIKLVQAFEKSAEKKNSKIKVLGLTATANNKTEDDIKLQLSSINKKVQVHRESMNRPNIRLSVFQTEGLAEKLLMLEELVKRVEGDGLVYCATRDNTELVAEYLREKRVNAIAYHAGFGADEKRKLQQEFTNGKYKVIAATNALGMGIDKADLRFVIHFDVPGSITAYYQEVGRSGRDGLPAEGILLFDSADKKIQEYFINSSQPIPEDFRNVLQVVKTADVLPKITDIKRLVAMHPNMVTVVVAELIEQGYLEKKLQNRAQIYFATDKEEEPNLERYRAQLQIKTHELQAILNYAKQVGKCRMMILRQTLGDTSMQACGHCDICDKSHLQMLDNPIKKNKINDWLAERVVRTSAASLYKVSAGIAVFYAKLRAPLFVKFMQERTQNIEVCPEILALIKKSLAILVQQYRIGCVIPIPSRTWNMRNKIAQFIADQLQMPVLDCLCWNEVPISRQGELLNNDQRSYNVNNKMTAKLRQNIPKGAILLLDDYMGSGATIKEAARVLRKKLKTTQKIVPFTLAAIKWRLGKRGMI